MNKYVAYKDLPKCCIGCPNRDSDSQDEYSPSYHYCTKNLILPTKKHTCSVKDKQLMERTK